MSQKLLKKIAASCMVALLLPCGAYAQSDKKANEHIDITNQNMNVSLDGEVLGKSPLDIELINEIVNSEKNISEIDIIMKRICLSKAIESIDISSETRQSYDNLISSCNKVQDIYKNNDNTTLLDIQNALLSIASSVIFKDYYKKALASNDIDGLQKLKTLGLTVTDYENAPYKYAADATNSFLEGSVDEKFYRTALGLVKDTNTFESNIKRVENIKVNDSDSALLQDVEDLTTITCKILLEELYKFRLSLYSDNKIYLKLVNEKQNTKA